MTNQADFVRIDYNDMLLIEDIVTAKDINKAATISLKFMYNKFPKLII